MPTSTSITPEQMRKVCGGASLARVIALHPHFVASLPEGEITTPARAAMYLAQLAEETCELRYLEEIASGVDYDPTINPRLAAKLGNTKKGDGRKYKGRGALQLTGATNYRAAGLALGLPLIEHPELAALPEHAFRVSAYYWRTHDLNVSADACDVIGATRKINGGLNGLIYRLRYYERARAALGLPAIARPELPIAIVRNPAFPPDSSEGPTDPEGSS
jgi:predicted chitinase